MKRLFYKRSTWRILYWYKQTFLPSFNENYGFHYCGKRGIVETGMSTTKVISMNKTGFVALLLCCYFWLCTTVT